MPNWSTDLGPHAMNRAGMLISLVALPLATLPLVSAPLWAAPSPAAVKLCCS